MGVCSLEKENKTFNKRTNESKIIDSEYEDIDRYFTKVSKSICKLVINHINASGFLLKYNINEIDFFFLFSNAHVITEENIKNKETIIGYYDNEFENFSIKLEPNERYIKN